MTAGLKARVAQLEAQVQDLSAEVARLREAVDLGDPLAAAFLRHRRRARAREADREKQSGEGGSE